MNVVWISQSIDYGTGLCSALRCLALAAISEPLIEKGRYIPQQWCSLGWSGGKFWAYTSVVGHLPSKYEALGRSLLQAFALLFKNLLFNLCGCPQTSSGCSPFPALFRSPYTAPLSLRRKLYFRCPNGISKRVIPICKEAECALSRSAF